MVIFRLRFNVPDHYSKSNHAPFDIAVVGGGVVGCAVARRLTLDGARAVLVEKAADILSGASKGNSALLHTGFDAPPGSIELECMKAGYAEYLAIRAGLNLPLLQTGAVVVAWNDEETERLGGIAAQAHENGVPDVEMLTAAQVLQREPHLSAKLKAGLLVPGEHVIDPWSAPLAYLGQALANGASVQMKTEIEGGTFSDGVWTLNTSRGPLQARYVVNCAGLYGDLLDRAVLGDTTFAIKPRKGEFLVFDKAASALLETIILPVPTATTKGVVLARTVFGNVLVGPTAQEQESRDDTSVSRDALERLLRRAVDIMPALAGIPVTATYAGLRPASESKEYRIRRVDGRNWLTLGGIRSTGLTAALGLARLAACELGAMGWQAEPLCDPVVPAVPNLAQHLGRDWQRLGYDEIVCHCEMVTRREIAAALQSPVPPGDIGGLKRRTRAGMGRCQGFHCSARLATITQGLFDTPLALEEDDGR